MDKEIVRHLIRAMDNLVNALEKLEAEPVAHWQAAGLPSIGFEVREARAELEEATGRVECEALHRAMETLKRFPR